MGIGRGSVTAAQQKKLRGLCGEKREKSNPFERVCVAVYLCGSRRWKSGEGPGEKSTRGAMKKCVREQIIEALCCFQAFHFHYLPSRGTYKGRGRGRHLAGPSNHLGGVTIFVSVCSCQRSKSRPPIKNPLSRDGLQHDTYI